MDLKAIDAVRRLQQNPNLGAFRVHAALAQIGVHLSPRTCGRILATNRALYGLSSRRWTNLMLSNHVPELSSRAGNAELGERVLRVFNSAETGYEKPHPEAYRLVQRTLGDEVEAVRRVIRTGREEVGVPELCFSHGDQQNPPKLSQ